MVYENKTVDTPNDMAMREEQKRVRLQQGAALAAKPDKKYRPHYNTAFTFRFRQIKDTQFAGLWELCAMTPEGKVDEQVVDADTLSSVLETIGNIFENEGF